LTPVITDSYLISAGVKRRAGLTDDLSSLPLSHQTMPPF